MLNKMLKVVLLVSLSLIYVSCSTDSRSLIEGRVVDKLTDTALNSGSSKNDSGSTVSGRGGRSKGSYSGGATGDEHYIDDDIIFVSKEPFKGSGWIYVQPAREVEAPTAKTKNEGKFMIVHNGDEMWTKNFWKTRIAKEKEIKIGAIVVAFNRQAEEGIYVAPDDKESAINESWFMAKVTDLSNKYRGYVVVSGGYKVSMENMRVVVK